MLADFFRPCSICTSDLCDAVDADLGTMTFTELQNKHAQFSRSALYRHSLHAKRKREYRALAEREKALQRARELQRQPTVAVPETKDTGCQHPVETVIRIGGVGDHCNLCGATVNDAGEKPVPAAGWPIDYSRRVRWMR